MNEQPDRMNGKDKKKGRNRFNMLFTLLFIIAIFVLLFNMMGDDSWGESKISPLTFYKLLYTCKITKLEVSGAEKIEGEYTTQSFSADSYDSGWDDPANRKKFFVELSREELRARVPEFSNFLGRTVQKGSGDLLWSNLVEDRILITSYYKVVCDDPDLVNSALQQEEAGAIERMEGTSPAALLFVDFVDGNGASRFERYDLSGASVSSGNTWNAKKILASIGEKFPNAEYREFSLQNEGSLRFSQPNTFLTSLVATLIPWVLIIGIFWFFILRQMKAPGGGGGVLSFGRSRATVVNKEKTDITFKDVAGIEEAKEEVTEIIEFLKDPGRFSRLGGRVPRGVLLVGSPGTGKTLLAKAIAGEADVPFYSISGSDFVEMFVGVGASRVRDLFRQARENSPCLIFLDEIDAVGRKRGSGLGGGHDEREQTLNAILVEMDGFETDEGVILLAATNRPDVLDPALLRPGRFDREIVIDLPDLNGRKEILEVHCRKIKLAENVDLEVIARGTPSFSGAELAALVNESALIATMKDKSAVDVEDLEEARDKVRWGRQKKSRVMDEEDRTITAYHEAGHALAAHLLPETEPLHKVTIIPRGMALGATMQLPEKDRYHHRRKELLGNLVVLYAGRVAEEIFCGDISGGAQNDIERASEIARIMVCRLGMSENVGPISYDSRQDHVFLGEELVRSQSHGAETLKKIDEEVRKILGDGFERARKLIGENKDQVEAITRALLEYEVLSGTEVSGIIAGRSIEEIKAEAEAAKEARETDIPSPEKEEEGVVESEEKMDEGDLPAEGEFAY
jgi:cell division protease FtsH